MRKRIFTSTIAALALFAVVGLIAALAPSIAWPNLARAHSPGGASLTALTVTSDGTALPLTPTFSSTVHYYTVPVADTVSQITIEATPGGDGTVAYKDEAGTALPDADATTDGMQVDIPADGKRINVEVTHTDGAEMTEETYGVLVIREGPAVPDTIVLMALYDSTNGEGWTTNTNWGSTVPIEDWHGVNTDTDGRVTTLRLRGNDLSGTLPASLGNLTNLQELSLNDTKYFRSSSASRLSGLSGTIPASLGNLTKLTLLSLARNQLTGEIPEELGNLTNLTTLELDKNLLSGPIPDLSNLTSLTHLYLNKNQLSGEIPASLDSLTSLVHLHLHENQLTGEIPASLGNLPTLLELYLWGNQLTGEIPASLGNLTTLRKLYLSKNQLTGEIPASLGNLTALRDLYLDANQLSGTIPDLSRLTNLQHLYLWGNQLDGRIPDWLGDLTNLQSLYLNKNQLSGEIPDLSRLTNLQSLILNNNQLSGEIPDLSRLTSLYYLYLHQNQLTGGIPASLGNLTNLYYLFLNNNQLSGEIPDLSRLTSLTHLYLHQNELSGGIPATLNSLTSLVNLFLDDNQLSGEIPDLSRLTNLQQLSLRRNQLSGPIPDLSSLTSLTRLTASLNQLSGTIPSMRGLTNLRQLGLDQNKLSGPIPDLSFLTNLTTLLLSENQLSGEIPSALGNLANLKIARFASNTDAEGNPSLTGCVPVGLRFLVTADEFAPGFPAHDFIPKDANNDGDFDDFEDTPGLNLPFCMVSALTFSDVPTLVPSFASGTVAYTASVATTVAATTVTATLPDSNDRLSIRKGTNSYTSGGDVPLAVGQNEITITVTPRDGTPTLTYTVTVFRAGVDRDTLMELYNSTRGASWTTNTSWGSTEPLNDWFGVTADSDNNVTKLELSDNKLSGTLLPASLGSLTSLITLDLSDNRGLGGTIPDLSAVTNLEVLSLGGNQFSGPIPDLSALTSLTTLNLRDNQLTGAIPEELGGLQLDVLYLDDNQLSGPIPAALGSLSGLDVARFAGNALTGCVPNGLRRLVGAPVFNNLPAHDFIAVGGVPGLGLPFCTLESLTLDDVTLEPPFASDTVVYAASAAHAVTSPTVTATLYDSSDTISIMKGADTYMSGDPVPLDVGPNVITITVTTSDDTPSPHTYTVTVTRAPNTPPTFNDGPTTTRGVDENTTTNENIGGPVGATDDDSDTLTYSLDATSAASFDIDADGQLRTKADLDYETQSSYTVTVSVSDSKDDNSAADEVTDDTIRVTILVANMNEDPEFPTSETGMRSVDENTIAGVNIGAPFTATDGDNDTLTYSLDDTGAESFDIDASSGQLRTRVALDFEEGDTSYSLTVTAADPSNESATVDVTITVTNINEDGTVTLSSTQPIVDTALTATLEDPDEVRGSATWLWASSPNGASSWTPISAATSDTYTPVTADVGNYLRATASYDDGQGSGKSARAVSANPVRTPTPGNAIPQFPQSETGARSVTENTPAGTDIGEPVAATDPEGDTLTYSLDVYSAASFDIGASSGQLQTKAALDFETPANYFIIVTATDTAGGTGTITVTITVNNLDEPGTVTLSSLQPLVAIPLTATLDDPDDVSGSGTWLWERSPDGTSPWTPISEASDSYTPVFDDVGDYLRATASYNDGEGGGKSAQAISAHAVELAPGRNAPVFTEGASTTRSVAKSTPAGRNIGAPVSATDADNDALTYSLGGPDRAGFDLDTTSGQLRTKAPLTGIRRTSYSVFVSVSDGKDDEGNPDTTTDSTIAVTILVTEVTEVNEAPVFPSAMATRTIPENTPAGRNIGAPVSATDADNDPLTYSLGGTDAASFDIGSTDGQLQTKAPLNRASRSSYTVFVSVRDSKDDLGEPDTAIDATTEVTINVTTTTTATATATATTRPSGGSSGGGRSRATPTPTATPSPTPTATPTPTGPQFSGVIAAEPSVTATVVPEGTTLGLNGGGDLPGGVYVNFPPTAVALPVHVSVSVSNEAPSDVTAPSGTTLLPLTINITTEPPLILGEPLTIEINPTPEQLAAAGGDLNKLSVGVVTPHGIVVLPTQVMHGRLVVTTDRIAPFVLLAVTDTGPVLTQPPMGEASSMGPLLQWTQPPRTTWFQVQVVPFSEDGPGINLVIGDRALVRGAQYQVLGPNFGGADPNYVMLPGMTYLWRVRTTTVLTNPTEADWSAWAVSSFKTPPASSSTITPVAPQVFGEVSTLTPTLTWANSNAAVFYYEVQVSRDYEFGPNAFLYSEYVHGGASTPTNSYVVPEAFPLEAGEIYYWRVRPRIQGDGDPLPWSATYVFLAPG